MTLEGLGYAAAVALAALLVVAAVAKLRAPTATERSFAALGVPDPRAAARLVPLPELAVAVVLVVVPVAGALAALVLLAFFSTFVAGRLRAGVVAPCACFGAASAAPLSWLTLVRNGALAVLALAALATTGPTVPAPADVVVVLAYVLVAGSALQRAERAQAS